LSIRKWYLYALTLGASLVVVWLWYEMYYANLAQQEQRCVSSINGLEKRKAQLPDVRYQVGLIQQRNDQIKKGVRLWSQQHIWIDPYVQLERVLIGIDASGLQLASLSPQEFKRKIFYEKCLFSFKVLGGFEHIMKLLLSFSEDNLLARFKKAVITHADDDQLLFESTVALYAVDKEEL